ncbi:MAG TPA: response regulator [Polyangiaceae bacterium]|jgi:CheY-like chemotaxis protein|nr:response regulator [Polyangiaceae bacterium]
MNGLPRVLLVDDDDGVRRVLNIVLGSAGFEVLLADSGGRALQLFREQGGVDVILTDLRMPEMHGSDFIRAMRKLDRHVPIIVLTGNDPGSVPEGASQLLIKPVQPAILIEALRNVTILHSGHVRLGNMPKAEDA